MCCEGGIRGEMKLCSDRMFWSQSMLSRERVMGRMTVVSRNMAWKTHGMTGCDKVPVFFLF